MKKLVLIITTIVVVFSAYIKNSWADDFDEEIFNFDKSCEETSAEIGSELKLNSRIAVAYDRENDRVIWGKDENKKTAMASTTKILTAIITIENSNLDAQVDISAKAASTGGSRLGLKKGDKVSLRDLLYGLMLRSGNDAAVAIAEFVGGSVPGFADLMNKKAVELKLESSHFVTPHGLDNPDHYTTAKELAEIADYALENDTFCKIVGTKNYTISINGCPKNISNTNELLGYVPNVYGVKTGFTNNAGRCLVTAIKKDNMDIITVVIQADTKKDRSRDSINLINYIFDNYKKTDIQEVADKEFYEWCDINLKRIYVHKARSGNIEIYKGNLENNNYILNKEQSESIRTEINAIYNLEAPVKENTIIGEQKIFIDNKVIEVNRIYIKNNIDRMEVFDYFRLCLEKIF